MDGTRCLGRNAMTRRNPDWWIVPSVVTGCAAFWLVLIVATVILWGIT
jgi:hypothetical protein